MYVGEWRTFGDALGAAAKSRDWRPVTAALLTYWRLGCRGCSASPIGGKYA
jgi:hypothetical protein